MIKISIVLPVYNVEPYLTQCIDSLVNQTMKDLEFIFIDDGSTDNSLNIIKEYAKKDSRFVLLSQANQGPGVARNKGIKIARGEYLTCLDPDDWFELDAMDKLYKKLKETGAQALQFNWIYQYEMLYNNTEHKKVVYASMSEKLLNAGCKKIFDNDYFCWKDYKKQFFILSGGTWGRIYSTKFIREHNIHFSEILIGEDRLFGIMSLICSSKIYYLDEHLYNYRVRANSITRKLSDKYFDNPFICYDEIEEFLKRKGYFNDLIDEFNESKIRFFKMVYLLLPKQIRKEYRQVCKEELSNAQYKAIFRLKQSFLKSIFSVENVCRYDGKYKQIVILGVPIEIKKSS